MKHNFLNNKLSVLKQKRPIKYTTEWFKRLLFKIDELIDKPCV